MKKPSFYLAAALAALGLAALSSTGLAQTFVWDGNGTGGTKNWSDGVNWDSDSAPTAGSDVAFFSGTPGATNINIGDVSSGLVTFNGTQNVAFNFQAGNWTVSTGFDKTSAVSGNNYNVQGNATVNVDADGIYLNHRGSAGTFQFNNAFVGTSTANITINDFTGGTGYTVRVTGNNTAFLGSWVIRRATLSIDGNPNLALGGATPSSKVIFNNYTGGGGTTLTLNTGTGNTVWNNDFINNNASTNGGSESASITFSGGTGSNASLTLGGNFSTGASVHSSSRLNFTAQTSTGASNASEGRILLNGNWSGYNGSVAGIFVSGAGSVIIQNASALAASNVNYELNWAGNSTVGSAVPGAGLAMSSKLILGGNFTMNNNLLFSGNGGQVHSFGAMNGGGTSAMNGTVSVNDPQGANLFSANSTGTMRFTNNISANNAANPLLINGNFTYNPGTGAQNFTPAGIVEFARATGISYNGSVTVNAGTLLVNNTSGNGTGSGALTVLSGATLGGNGIITAATTINGTLSPGNSPGTLTINNALALDSTAVLEWEINTSDTTVGGGINDLVTGVTNLTLDGTINFSLVGGPQITSTGTWRLLNYTGTLTNNTLSIGTLSLGSGLSANIDTTVANQVNLVVIPEPSTWALIGIGAAAVVLLRRRRIS